MEKNNTIDLLPSTLNVVELMEIKGGLSDSINDICVFGVATYVCKDSTPAKVECKGDTPAIITCSQGGAIIVCTKGAATSPTPPDPTT